MVDERLAAYARNMLNEGYSREAIKSQLLRYGYPASDVDAALGSKSKIIALVFVVLVVIGALFLFLFLQLGEEGEDIALTITINPEENVPLGGVLSFTLTLESDVPPSVTYGRVKYHVVGSQGGVEASKEERLSLLQTNVQDSISLPRSVIAGTYTLIAEVSVGGSDFTDSASFLVVEDDSTGFSGERVGPPSLEEGKHISDIVTLSNENAVQARDLCLEFTNQLAVDQCLLESALSTNNELFCPDIRNADKRDTCYFNLMLILGKRELCGGISNRNLKGTCLQI